MIHIAICDDEQEFVSEMKALLERYAKEKQREIRISSFENGLALTKQYDKTIDLIFLDIQMDGMDGLKTAEQIRALDEEVSIIFLTSLKQYALEGYQYRAENYIVKPMKYIRLKVELDRWMEKQQKKNPFIVVENDKGTFKVALNTLHYIETYKRNLILHTDKEEILSYRKMSDMEEELRPYGFFLCHRGFLVNMGYVKQVEKLDVHLTFGETIYVSKPKKKEFMEAMAAYWGKLL